LSQAAHPDSRIVATQVGDTASSATHASLELALAQHSSRVIPAPEVASHRQKVEEYRGVASLTGEIYVKPPHP